jgi:hypothetical protein
MPVEIHAPMQDADDIDAVRQKAIEQDVRTGRILAVARPDLIAASARFGSAATVSITV